MNVSWCSFYRLSNSSGRVWYSVWVLIFLLSWFTIPPLDIPPAKISRSSFLIIGSTSQRISSGPRTNWRRNHCPLFISVYWDSTSCQFALPRFSSSSSLSLISRQTFDSPHLPSFLPSFISLLWNVSRKSTINYEIEHTFFRRRVDR